MNIPKATLSATQFRTYGTGGFTLEDHEDEQGCPRQYAAKYVWKTVPKDDVVPYPLRYGSFFHTVLHLMEQGRTPDEALAEAFEPDMPQEMWTEAREDLDRYIERGATPTDRYATLDAEIELSALLYEDEEFGPIYYRGFLDWLGIDFDQPNVLHSVDYKTNRRPPNEADLAGDVQMRGYHWLVLQNHKRWTERVPRIVTHYDAVKFREVTVTYTDRQIDDWHSWAVAVARAILRDTEFLPILNPGCPNCPVKRDCPAFATLPVEAAKVAAAGKGLLAPADGPLATLEDRLKWRDQANQMRLVLEKSVKDIDESVAADVRKAKGPVVAAGYVLSMEPKTAVLIDLPALHTAMGTPFYSAISTSRTAIERETGSWGTDAVAAVNACMTEVTTGTKLVKRKNGAKK